VSVSTHTPEGTSKSQHGNTRPRRFPAAATFAAGFLSTVMALSGAASASADYDTVGYTNSLYAAGLIDHGGDP
jgi:hypothetical protein